MTVVAREVDPAAGVAVVQIDAAGGRHPLRALSFSRAAARAARGRDFDIVHSFSRTRHQDLFRAGGGSHDDYLRRTHSRFGQGYRRLLPRHWSLLALERRVFADSDQRIQCASRLVADRLAESHGVARERILLLPNAVDAERFDPGRNASAGRRLRQQLDERAECIWLFPASGWHRKGLDLCLAAMARLADPGLRLWLAGRDDPGPWSRQIAAAGLGERVRLLGPRRDLEIVYAAVDGMLLPTRYDPFANVTFEAAAAGLPILTTRANGAAEWLSANACRVLDEPTSDALADALRALRNAEIRKRLGDAARSEIAAYHWPGHVTSLREEYRRIVAARRERRERATR